MADADPTFDLPVPRDAVERSAGGSYWSVSGCGWDADGPALPEEYAAHLAPPIVVGAAARPPDRVIRRIPDTTPAPPEPPPGPAPPTPPAPPPVPAPPASARPASARPVSAPPVSAPPASDGRRSTLEMLIFEPRPPGRHRRR
jgi:hypothetical protein